MCPLGASFRSLIRVVSGGAPPAVPTTLEDLQAMDVGYLGGPFVAGQVNLTNGDDDLQAMDVGYLGGPFVVWSNI